MFDGILFDLDGTLWDATLTICAAWNHTLDNHPQLKRGPVTREEICACMGLLLEDIGSRLVPELSHEDCRAFVADYFAFSEPYLKSHGGILYPQVAETLAALQKIAPLYVVSNCQDGYIQGFFAAHHLGQYFSGFECAGRTGMEKSGNIALVVRENGLKNPVYIGDTQLDYTSARAVGVPFLHAAYGFGTIDAAVPAAGSFGEIPAALGRMCPP
ncbi:MAG: HAD family hydrolase [Pseudoflavonifractor sp.]